MNDSRQAGTEVEGVEVTPEMAELGAMILRDARLGCDLRELATDVFNMMLAEAHAQKGSASVISDL